MDSFQAYTYGTAAWLALQSIPLLLAPRLIITLLSPSMHDVTASRSPTPSQEVYDWHLQLTTLGVRLHIDLESYFARATALAQVTLALLTILNSDIFAQAAGTPFSSDSPSETQSINNGKKPHATPTLVLTALYHLATCIYAYVKYTGTGQTMFMLGSVGAGMLAGMGGFVLMFGDERARGCRWPFESAEQRASRKEKKRVGRRKGL